ncbi:MAG: prepilin peptidase [Anaerolineales bacterium]|nr:prepilin peptidase [Anaerolineales bacterium]MDO9349298.1 prepilin peptidase [Anaerolineales bacterium]
MLWMALLLLTIFVSLYDLRTRRIPNWVTLPLFLAGLVAHFPGTVPITLACILFISAYVNHWMGAKLWIALLWAIPPGDPEKVIGVLIAMLFVTGLAQMLVRGIRKAPLTGISSPAARRTIPFVLALWYVH